MPITMNSSDTVASPSNTGTKRAKKRAFPFSTIIVTNPDEASARSAQKLLDSTLKRYLNQTNAEETVQIISTCDPFGARCGSFGGTLAALEGIPNSKISQTVLCLHAGGDSSRCPLSMILGKAWTNLPSENNYRNPIAWLIHQLEDLFYSANIPKGSLVVTATDCLISLGESTSELLSTTDEWVPSQSINESSPNPCTVLGVAVPAPLTTAKNHGVFVMPENMLGDDSSQAAIQIETPVEVWQKPSVEKLETRNVSFEIPSRTGLQAWIDVGIVVFFPKAFKTLAKLSDGLLSRCTRKGLEAAFQQETNTDLATSLESYAKANALKVDLYTDILHNLPLGESSCSESMGDSEATTDSNNIQGPLRKILSSLPLQVLVVPEGSFLHLGTTRELIEFVTTPNTTTAAAAAAAVKTRITPSVMDQHVTQNLVRALRLNPRFESISAPILEESKDNTTICSIFPSTTNQKYLGSSTVVEYSDLENYESLTIGNHCMLSGWRRDESLIDKDNKEPSLTIPDGMSVQLLPLENSEEEKFVMMVLGTTDSIKSPISSAELYGAPFLNFLEQTGLTPTKLGFGDELCEHDNLWNAKIHPIVSTLTSAISFSSLFGWIDLLRNHDPNLRSDTSLSNWLSAKRVSLREIHGISDASKEWAYRMKLETKIWNLTCQKHVHAIVELLKNRCQTIPCDLEWLIEVGKNSVDTSTSSFAALSELVAALEELALEEFSKTNYDISGRALMLASATIADFPSHLIAGHVITPVDEDNPNERFLPTDRMSIVRNLFGVHKSDLWRPTIENMSFCLAKLERLAFSMNELAISSGFQQYLVPDDDSGSTPNTSNLRLQRTSEILTDKFVLSVAPVRVDLAGGWSDTPPITYEFGGSVTGMAVLVDGRYPLSCRSRLVSGKTGILLKTELRDLSSGSLVSEKHEEITEMSQLSNFRDPSASCALLKAALVCLGMVSEEDMRFGLADLQELINIFCSSPERNIRIEIVTTSLLGLGTGMGTSSILGACILQSVATCVGIGKLDDKCLIHAVLVLEQLLSSGGGWQDQAHGILPGIKTVTSAPQIPLDININPLKLSEIETSEFEDKLLFAYTGKTRLAKNILQQVLRRWARRTDEIVETVQGLVDHSVAVREALKTKSWNELGAYMYQAYMLKCVMAGESSGAEPDSVQVFVSEMMKRKQIRGAMLCGAGGGGFLLLLLAEDTNRAVVERTFQDSIAPLHDDFADFCFHDCAIAQSGLSTNILRDDSESSLMTTDTFELSWHLSFM